MQFSLNTEIFFEKVITAMRKSLPGVNAHLRLAPQLRIKDLHEGLFPENAVQSAVILLLYPAESTIKTVFIQRNEYDGAHSGQVSLPGGKFEPADQTLLNTALREMQEEIGVEPSEVKVIGPLSMFYVRPSNFIIQPYVGIVHSKPTFRCDPVEVQNLVEANLFEDLAFEKIVTRDYKTREGLTFTAPGWKIGASFLWGATAMIVSEFMTIISESDPKTPSQG